MATRLTKLMREKILQRLLKRRFDAEKSKLIKERGVLAQRVYQDIYPVKVREQMMALAPGWLPMKGHFCVALSGNGRDVQRLNLPEERPFLAKHCDQYGSGRVLAVYEVAHAFTQRHRELDDQEEALQRLEKELKAKTRALLFSVTTVEKLLEAWPDVAPFVTDLAGETTVMNLPAELPKELSEALRLDHKAA